MRHVTGIFIMLILVNLLAVPVFAWGITIDLDYITQNPVNSRDCVVNILDNTITVDALIPEGGGYPVTIKGDGTNNGLGWGITIFNASYVFIEDHTIILGSQGRSGLSLISGESVTLAGGGPNIVIGSIMGSALYSSAPNLTLEGELGEIIGGNRPNAMFGGMGIIAPNLFIAGRIGLIAGGLSESVKGDAICTVNDGKTTITGNINVNGNINTHLTLQGDGRMQRMLGVPFSILLQK